MSLYMSYAELSSVVGCYQWFSLVLVCHDGADVLDVIGNHLPIVHLDEYVDFAR